MRVYVADNLGGAVTHLQMENPGAFTSKDGSFNLVGRILMEQVDLTFTPGVLNDIIELYAGNQPQTKVGVQRPDADEDFEQHTLDGHPAGSR